MTSTEVADPFAHVRAGQSIGEHHDWSNPVTGIWSARGYEWCAVPGPETGFVCSRPRGHPTSWQHTACTEGGNDGRGTIHEVWGGVVLEPDPCGDVTVGTRVRDHGFPRMICHHDSNEWCNQQAPGSSAVCSRIAGHAAHWQHIAATERDVLSVWGGPFVDPFADVMVEARPSSYARWDDNVIGMRVRNARYCRAINPEHHTRGAFCTRAVEHEGQHISTSETRIFWTMPNERTPEDMPAPDPEDGSPVDDESAVYTEAPEIGDVVKLRDRRNRLYVMSQRKDTPEVEVLDLERKELRAIPIDRCVKQTDPLTIDELQWVAQWYAGHRNDVRKIAVREYRKDRWCMAGLNQNLRELGLTPYEPTLHGTILVQLPFDCVDIHAGQDAIEAKVMKALSDPSVSAALRVALPSIEEIKLLPDELTVRATNFTRK